MVDGQWLMRDGRIVTLDEDAMVREADRVARTAWRRLFEARPELIPPSGMYIRE
jgi:5-methylthioadenosine/S-adenosylhomocysteine deaminase